MDAPHRSRTLIGALVLVVALACGLSAAGGRVSTQAAASENEFVPFDIAGVTVLNVRVPVEGDSPLQRVELLYRRWVDALEAAGDSLSPDLVRIEEGNGLPKIYVGSVMLIDVDEEHARLNGATPQQLAEIWARNLRRAIARHLEIHQP